MLRRPLLFPAVGFAAAVLFSYYLGILIAVIAFAVMFVLCIMQKQSTEIQDKNRCRAVLFLVGFIAGVTCFCMCTCRFGSEADRLLASGDKEVMVEAVVTDREDKETSSGDRCVELTADVFGKEGKSREGKVLVRYYNETDAVPGMSVSITGVLSEPQKRRNPGCFDYSLYLKSLGITAVMTANRVEMTGGEAADYSYGSELITGAWHGIQTQLYLLKDGFTKRLAAGSNEETAALMRAIMFGDKGLLDRDVLDTFQKNGTAHVLAVSGLHIGIIYAFILRLWRGRKGKLFFLFTALFFGCYIVLAGFSPSVVRAVFMVLLHIFAQLRGKRYDLNNAAFVVALAVLMHNPYMIFNTGFQMSFLAVLTMTLVLPYIGHFYSGIFLVSLVVQIGLGPYIIWNFNYISLASILVNVPVVALAGIIVPMGLVTMVLENTLLFGPLAKGVDCLCMVLKWVNEVAEIEGITVFQITSPPLWIMALYYLGLLTLATEEGRLGIMRAASKLRHVCRVLALILAVSIAFGAFAGDGFEDCNLTFVDVGQGDCVCIRTDGGMFGRERCWLFDGGGNGNYNVGKQTLRPYLLKNGISHVDGVFVTHLHTDHYKGVCELAREGMVDRIYTYEGNRAKAGQICNETGLPDSAVVFLHAGKRIELGTDGGQQVYVNVLWPEAATDAEYLRMLADEENENAMSLIFRLDFDDGSGTDNGCTSVLINGDMGEDGEIELMQALKANPGAGTNKAELLLHADILKVGHHGSKSSTCNAFLDTVSPDFAVIQVGKNNYGHPTPETLERLAERGVTVYRNDLDGAVGFEIKRGEIKKVRRMVE